MCNRPPPGGHPVKEACRGKTWAGSGRSGPPTNKSEPALGKPVSMQHEGRPTVYPVAFDCALVSCVASACQCQGSSFLHGLYSCWHCGLVCLCRAFSRPPCHCSGSALPAQWPACPFAPWPPPRCTGSGCMAPGWPCSRPGRHVTKWAHHVCGRRE